MPKRATRTSYQPGQSGNPAGRPPVNPEVRELSRAHTPLAIRRLAEIVKKADSDSASVSAASILLDRGWGKAPQTITAEVAFATLTDEQLETRKKEIVARAVAEQAAPE